MSLEAWTAIGACATGVMAIATFLVVWQSRTLSGETRKLAEAAQDSLKVSQGLAATNQDLVKANRDLVKSNEELVRTSHDLVEASREEAAATKELAVEARNDRELACQPWIGIAPPPGGESDFVRVGIPMIVRNIGGGPALGLRAFWWPDHDQNDWWRSASLHLGAAESVDLPKALFTPMQPLPVYSWFGHGADPSVRESQGTLVFFWRDILGWRYRLPVIRFPVLERPGVPAKGVCDPRVGDPERRRPTPGVHDWESDIRIFPSTE